jgi:hypothetical protein
MASAPINQDGEPVDLTDYEQFMEMAKEMGRPAEMLIALSSRRPQ